MCGIVGAIAQRNISDLLVAGLQSLEYRGYDSAGIAVIDKQQHLHRSRVKGKVNGLAKQLAKQPLPGLLGIAHTRWATHGSPCERNAHPHTSAQRLAIVHNGIIENHQVLREQLTKQGYDFTSDTDSEVIVHLLASQLSKHTDFLLALRETVALLQGAFALGIIDSQQPQCLFAVRQGGPLVIGVGDDENFIASDPMALLPVTQQFMYLEDGDIAQIRCDGMVIYDQLQQRVQRSIHDTPIHQQMTERGDYQHYMLKEIFEQPAALTRLLHGCTTPAMIVEKITGKNVKSTLQAIKHIQIVACGASYYAGMVARYWLESLSGLPCRVDIASELRYHAPIVAEKTLLITLSQSGETADTLAALHAAQQA
ncbi:MAG: glutamine--fructose-6-phosphate transaminase (isomerizing), partial [Gammaproteobacteria bacterium]|nr:glutamine--fructose-6-phosphate transaminase (isomerizing) [Gammaproteobacteria bacterium]